VACLRLPLINFSDLGCKNGFAHIRRESGHAIWPSSCARRSHGRRYSIPADSPRATLQRSIGLLNRDDEDFCTRLEIAPVPRHVNNDGRIGGGKDFFFSLFLFSRPRFSPHPRVTPFNLLNVRVGHCARRLKIPWIVSFSGSAHGLGKDMYFQCALAAVSPRHRRDTHERAPLDV